MLKQCLVTNGHLSSLSSLQPCGCFWQLLPPIASLFTDLDPHMILCLESRLHCRNIMGPERYF